MTKDPDEEFQHRYLHYITNNSSTYTIHIHHLCAQTHIVYMSYALQCSKLIVRVKF